MTDHDHGSPPPKRGWLRHFRIRWWIVATVALLFGSGWWVCVRMPGKSFAGELPLLTQRQADLQSALDRWLEAICIGVGPRSTANPGGLLAALDYLESELRSWGYRPIRNTYPLAGREATNLIVELPGTDPTAGIFVVGAHYDAFYGTMGANDNGSGVAALLALAKRFSATAEGGTHERTVRFVFFTNEEPPHFQGESMGSRVYAAECRARSDDIRGMWSLETLAYYSDEPKSQRYPIAALGLAYPTQGNFTAFVGNVSSRILVRATIGRFRQIAQFPSEGAALPEWVPGVGWSDHWSFARVGYPALMVTDTAPFRDPAYHTANDLPGRLDLSRLARVADGLGDVLETLLHDDGSL